LKVISEGSTYDKKISILEKQNHPVATVEVAAADQQNPDDDTLDVDFMFFKDGYNPVDDNLEEEYELLKDDPDASDIMVSSTSSNHFGIQQTAGDGKP
jgi:hypothetical protein